MARRAGPHPQDATVWIDDAYWTKIGYDAYRAMVLCKVDEYGECSGPRIREITEEGFMGFNNDEERFRSYAERYIIERAHTFRAGHEKEDAWAALLDAKSTYAQIAGVASATYREQADTQAAPAGAGVACGVSTHITKINPEPEQVDKFLELLAKGQGTSKVGALNKLRDAMLRLKLKNSGALP
jgi:hypothetical protein